MCYNCGCGVPTDDMGRGKVTEGGSSLTEEDIKKMAEDWGMTPEEAKRNIYDLLKKQFEK
ncbi:MAG: hypothetical protein AAB801_00235 [Patescibacteria group bacterium]